MPDSPPQDASPAPPADGLLDRAARGAVLGVLLGGALAALATLWRKAPASLRSLTGIRQLALNVLITAILALLVLIVAKATFEDTVVIEALSVPKSLEETGYTGSVVSQRIIDQFRLISEKAKTSKERVPYGTGSRYSALASLELPSSDLSIRSIVAVLRNFLGIEDTRISGEITIEPPKDGSAPRTYVVTVRLTGPGRHIVRTRKSENLDAVLPLVANDLMDNVDGYVLASYYYGIGDGHEADRIIDRLIATADATTKAYAFNLRGLRLDRQGRPREAIAAYERAAREGPELGLPLHNWGEVLRKQQDYDGAIEKLSEALTKKVTLATTYNSLGLAFASKHEHDKAVEMYRKAIELDPKDGLPYRNWAIALRRQGNFAAADDKHLEAIELRPDDVSAHVEWGDTLLAQGRYDEAIEKYVKALEVDPRSGFAYSAWAELLRRRGEVEAAIATYHAAILIDPGYAYAYSGLGSILHRQHRLDEAAALYTKAIGLSPYVLSARCYLAEILVQRGSLKEGREEEEKAMKAAPKSAFVYACLASVLAGRRDVAETIAMYRRAVALSGATAEMFHNLGVLHFNRQEMGDAATAFARAVRLNPRNATFLLDLADSLREAGRLDEAIKRYEQSLAIEDRRETYVAFAEALDKKGDRKRAAEMRAKAQIASP